MGHPRECVYLFVVRLINKHGPVSKKFIFKEARKSGFDTYDGYFRSTFLQLGEDGRLDIGISKVKLPDSDEEDFDKGEDFNYPF